MPWTIGFVEHISPLDIVVTNDLLLTRRCLDKEAKVVDTRGREWTPDNIGEALATRELMATLRQMGARDLGPKPLKPKYRSLFLSTLDEVINAVLKKLNF